MLSIASHTAIYLAIEPTDMRKGFEGLSFLVSDMLKRDPLSGALFLFVNRRRDRLKVLYWDVDGFAIWYRRLEEGTFQIPTSNASCQAIEMRSDEFTMLLRGIDLSSVRRRKRFSLAS